MAKSKLNQVVAVVNGKKTETQREITNLHHKCKRDESFNGLRRHYTPINEEGEQLQDEVKNVQHDANEVLDEFQKAMTKMLDVVATQDFNNCEAAADVVVNEQVLLENVPVTHLLFLEKQLVDVRTFVDQLPTLDLNENWEFDEQRGVFKSEQYKTNRTQKELKYKVLYEATEHHPAQVEKWNVDEVVGHWNTQKFSTAIPIARKKELLARVKELQDAVKFARETANNMEVEQVHVGEKIFGYLLK